MGWAVKGRESSLSLTRAATPWQLQFESHWAAVPPGRLGFLTFGGALFLVGISTLCAHIRSIAHPVRVHPVNCQLLRGGPLLGPDLLRRHLDLQRRQLVGLLLAQLVGHVGWSEVAC